MGYTNSSLVNYTKISPNKTSPRNHKIDTISIHCVVGQCSVETLGQIFAPTSKQASSNYGVGYDGKIGMYVEEKDRSWCTSSSSNDNRAVTIEVASDSTHPYAITDKAYASLINLIVDICERNDIESLKWKGDKSLIGQVDKQNMTVHRWFANKACPRDYLYNLHGKIAEEVNARLRKNTTSTPSTPAKEIIYVIQVGAFSSKANANSTLLKLTKAGFETRMIHDGKFYKIHVGGSEDKKDVTALLTKVKNKGYPNAYIVNIAKDDYVDLSEIEVGDEVRVTKNISYTGQTIKLYYKTYNVIQVNGDRVVIGKGKTVTAAFHKDNLEKV